MAERRDVDPLYRVGRMLSRRRLLTSSATALAALGVAGGFAAVGASATSAAGTQASPQHGSQKMSSMANIVLVHGAWADGSSWSRVIPILESAGHHVVAVQLLLTSLADDIAAVRRALGTVEGSTVLVGHSLGGMSITGSATANVTALVYIAAFAPDEGETINDLNSRYPLEPGPQHIIPDSGGFLWIDQDAFPKVFAQDVDPIQARVMATVQHPVAASYLGAQSGTPAWKTIPSWYQVSENDMMINPDLERWMAKRIGATTISLPSSHASMVSHPFQVAELILSAAES